MILLPVLLRMFARLRLRGLGASFLFLIALSLAACQSESSKTAAGSEVIATETATAESTPEPALVPDSVTPLTAREATITPLPTADTSQANSFYDAFGRYLAGLPARPGASLPDTAVASPRWKAFSRNIGGKWRTFDRTHTHLTRRWATRQLDSAAQPLTTVFYPFSGPDLLNVGTYFPQADTYVMVGLEPVGALPTEAVLAQPNLFKMVQNSLWSVLSFSFFRTESMATDFKSAELDGTMPVLLLFATRTGHRIIDAQLVHLSPEGTLQEAAAQPDTKEVPGSRLLLEDSTGHRQTVYYFSADISDGKLAANPGLLKFVGGLGPVSTFVKSASYLMHKSYFSRIRNTVLRQSNLILQDDSGIALRFFNLQDWQLTHYGHYTKPINLFAKHFQPDLLAAYQDSVHHPKPLPFGTGYNWRANESNLLLALRKTKS